MMNVKTFIDRPITSVMMAVSTILIGFLSLLSLPVEQFPDIAPPTVRVTATYTGASAETVMKSVAVPLESAINGVENMQYMTTTASNNGTLTINVCFKQGTNPDMAAVNVQNRVASAQGQLPAEVTKGGISVRKTQNSNLKFITLYSPHGEFDSQFLTNYLKINIEPRLARIPGVGMINVFGADYSLRIWLHPDRMKAYGLVPSDIDRALASQNLESPTGTLGAQSERTYQYVMKYRGRYSEPSDFGSIVVKASPDGQVLHLRDVADIELGSVNYDQRSTTLGRPGASASITQVSGTNAADIIRQIDQVENEVRKSLPSGMVLEDQTSVMDFLNASIRNVVVTLLLALLLVVAVVGAFLRDWRSTLIPSVAIVVSLVGTFIFMLVAGFSLNLLTLFALVLVIGTVVDDSVIVVEAVQARLSQTKGIGAYRATVLTTKELLPALVTTTVVFMAVFIPVSFVGGTSGIFYREFGLTMAAAVALSLLNALTLCPALSARMLRPRNDLLRQPSQRIFHRAMVRYAHGVTAVVRHHRWLAVAIPACLLGLAGALTYGRTSLVPQEDMGTIDVNVQCKPGYSLAQTGQVMDLVENAVRSIPQIKIYTRVDGRDAQQNQSSSAGFLSIRLKPWNERTGRNDGIDSVVSEIYRRTASIKEAKVNCGTLPMIRGYGSSSGFELYVQNRSGENVDQLAEVTRTFLDRLNQRPEIAKAHTNFSSDYPQLEVSVDAAQCLMHQVEPDEVLKTLSSYVGGDYASDFNRFTKTYRVMVQASADERIDEESLAHLYVRGNNGQLSPLSNYVTLKWVNGPEYLTHFNLFPSIRVNGTPAAGFSSGQALQAISEVARETLPVGFGYELSGMSREESSQGQATLLVLALSVVFIYMVLCSLYESLLVPFAVLLVIPFGLLGSFALAWMLGVENNIYMQTGIVMLVGMLAKTAILLTDVACECRRKRGFSLVAAALHAAKVRFRPIVMTATVMVCGMLPLLFSSGAGARGDLSIGSVVLGGMVAGTLALLFLVPALFCVMEWLDERSRGNATSGSVKHESSMLTTRS